MEVDGIEIKEKFTALVPYLQGTPKQFFVDQGKVYCLRAGCESCPYSGQGCTAVEEELHQQPVPNARRGIGVEGTSFLILLFKEGHSFETLPSELLGNPHAEKASDERNLHFILNNPSFKFHSFKGQLRYYGTRTEFEASPYAEYFTIFDEYTPVHYPVSIDYAAIEPRVSCLVSREPLWQEVFQGHPKAIVREVEIRGLDHNTTQD